MTKGGNVFDVLKVNGASELTEKQRLFAWLFHLAQGRAYATGHEVIIGETWRGPAQVNAYARAGKGHRKTLHALCLAGHLWLFLNGVYLTETSDYEALGTWWCAQHPLARWGGHFAKPDGVHLSVSHQGMA